MLNSLYGKFGQKAEVWEKIGLCPDEPDRVEICFKTEAGKPKQIRYLLGEIWELTGWEECFNSFPAIASQVTAYARMYMYDLMKITGAGNYFYMDTDSLIVNEAGYENLSSFLDPDKLGSLKLEETISAMTIYGLKDYTTDTKTVIKGIRKKAVEVSPGVYQQELWPSLKGMLREANTSTYTVKQQTKTLKRNYTKGIILDNGTVHPLTLDDADSLWQRPL